MEHRSKPLRIKGSANRTSFNDAFIKSKEQVRREHEKALEIFLKNGGVIQKIPAGVSAIDYSKKSSLVGTQPNPKTKSVE